MAIFPSNELEIVALTEQMIAGYTAHPADFPSIDPLTDLVALQASLDAYQADKASQEDARSQAKIATETKDTKLDALVETMRNDLKLSEVDTVDDPTKLAQIGWGPRQQPQPVDVPGQPTNLHPIAEGPGDIWLEWDRPATGGIVRNYVIERRQLPQGGGDFGLWEVVGTSLDDQVHLQEQPRGIQMEYWVKAVNIADESTPSNTAAVVL